MLLFKNEDGGTWYEKHYTQAVGIEDYNVLIDGKGFFLSSRKI